MTEVTEVKLECGRWYQLRGDNAPGFLYDKPLCYDGKRGRNLAFYTSAGLHYYFLPFILSDPDILFIALGPETGDTQPVEPITDDDILIDEPIPSKPKEIIRLRLRDAYPYDQLLTRVQELEETLKIVERGLIRITDRDIHQLLARIKEALDDPA